MPRSYAARIRKRAPDLAARGLRRVSLWPKTAVIARFGSAGPAHVPKSV
jgi:hypothetical protein